MKRPKNTSAFWSCSRTPDVVFDRWTPRFARTIEFGLEHAWLDQHPLSRHLLEEEAEQWQRVGVRFTIRELS